MESSLTRAHLYRFLAQALNYPVEELLSELQSKASASKMGEAAEGHPEAVREALCELQRIYQDASKDSKELLLDLERDYTWMFLASRPRLVHLFESVYKEGKLLQESTFEIARIYHQAGLIPSEEFRLPPDHIALEFELMAYLAYQETEAKRTGNKENAEYAVLLQEKVLNEHLSSFALNVAERVAGHAKTEFYRLVAQIIKGVISQPI
jgi:putative dimethyl sulfoxide reductase chaperone